MVFDSSTAYLWVVDLFVVNKMSEITTNGEVVRNCDIPYTPGPFGLGGLAIVGSKFYISEPLNPASPGDGTTIHVLERNSLICNPPLVVPFAAFDAKVEIELGPLANDDAFEVKGTFTLGAASDGIDVPTEIVSLQLSGGTRTFSTTIPAGSFQFVPAKLGKKPKPAHFKFEGIIDGVSLEAEITPLGGNTFEFKAEVQGAELTGIANPVTVTFTVGDDGGSTTVEAEFE